VRACVRDPSNEEKVAHLLALEGAKERLSLHDADLLKAGSYDQAFAGCDGVIHAAAVVDVSGLKGEEAEKHVVAPSVDGTKNVIAIINAAGTVKRVVHTSSIAAIMRADEVESHVFTEADWNIWGTVNNGDAYGYAKVCAERLSDEEAAKDGHMWDQVSINPHVILGPVMCKAHTKSSAALIRQFVYGNPVNNYFCKFVDVRDVATAHVEALTRPEAAGKRFLVINDSPVMNTVDLGAIAAEQCPEYHMSAKPLYSGWYVWLAYKAGFLAEYPYAMMTKKYEFDNSSSKAVLGMSYRPIAETVKDTALSMIDGGYIKGRPSGAGTKRAC